MSSGILILYHIECGITVRHQIEKDLEMGHICAFTSLFMRLLSGIFKDLLFLV